MDCPACGHPNRDGARFCGQCATPLRSELTCASCGSAQPATARHCDVCGRALSGGAQAPPEPPRHLADKIRAERAAVEGERKQVTVLFADVDGLDGAGRAQPAPRSGAG